MHCLLSHKISNTSSSYKLDSFWCTSPLSESIRRLRPSEQEGLKTVFLTRGQDELSSPCSANPLKNQALSTDDIRSISLTNKEFFLSFFIGPLLKDKDPFKHPLIFGSLPKCPKVTNLTEPQVKLQSSKRPEMLKFR